MFTREGEWVSAYNQSSAKHIYAIKHGVNMSGYIVSSKKGLIP